MTQTRDTSYQILGDENEHAGESLFRTREHELHTRIDRLFSILMVGQWIFGIVCAAVISPRTWSGTQSSVHIHLIAAIFLGGVICALPIAMAKYLPGAILTRHIVAASQVTMSALLIHLTSGRIETHFHIFGSLAFLMFYRDWRVLITATTIVTLDHILRGIYYPQSVYGVLSDSSWRWLEHAGWVIFEDVFLIYSCITSRNELRDLCYRQGELERYNDRIEQLIDRRTRELADTHRELDLQRSKSLESAKLASLGEMAGGIAHEINNPLAVINTRARHVQRALNAAPPDVASAIKFAQIIEQTSNRIASIISGLRSFSRNGEKDPFEICKLESVLEDVLSLCSENMRNSGIQLTLTQRNSELQFHGRSVQISQVFINLLNNARDAIANMPEKWIEVSVESGSDHIKIRFIDSGHGIPENLHHKIMQPFYTTKAVGHGTGLGLSISKGIIEDHGGTLEIDRGCKNTCFIVTLPKATTAGP